MSSPRGFGHDTKTLKVICAFDHVAGKHNLIEQMLRTEFSKLDTRYIAKDLTIFIRIDSNTLNENEVLNNW